MPNRTRRYGNQLGLVAGGITLTEYGKTPTQAGFPIYNQVPQMLQSFSNLHGGNSFAGNVRGYFNGYFGAGDSCPNPAHYVKGRGCCLDPKFRPAGAPQKTQCCGVQKTRLVKHPGGRFSLACKPAPGGGGDVGGARGGSFRVVSVSGATLTADHILSEPSCGPGETLELRRPGVAGANEFGGDVVRVSANTVTFKGHVKNPPAPGDIFILYCAGSGGGGNGGGGGGDEEGSGGFMEEGLFSEGFPWVPALAIAGLVGGAIYLSKKHSRKY